MRLAAARLAFTCMCALTMAVAATPTEVAPQIPQITPNTTPGVVRPVEVVNFPDPQNVAGSVSTSNLPAIQAVHGQVTISNLPPVQEVAGTVSVSNMNNCEERFELRGYSAQQFQGDVGFLTLTAACATQFPGSRMCSSHEVLQTVAPPELPAEAPVSCAWLRPAITFHPITGVVFDVSGASTASSGGLTCDAWRQADSSYEGIGVVHIPSGRISIENVRCDRLCHVACCSPTE